jgi:hypothetical protein
MATTVDDLIALKDEAVAACYAAVAAWEVNDLREIEAAANGCEEVTKRAELYDRAEEDDSVLSVDELEELEA